MKNYFYLNSIVPKTTLQSIIGGYVNYETYQSTSLEDYPVFNLAWKCGVKSVPYLKQIVLDQKVHEDNRFHAFVVLYQIDRNEAESTIEEYEKTLDPYEKKRFQNFLIYPRFNPWQLPLVEYPNERVEMKKIRDRDNKLKRVKAQ